MGHKWAKWATRRQGSESRHKWAKCAIGGSSRQEGQGPLKGFTVDGLTKIAAKKSPDLIGNRTRPA